MGFPDEGASRGWQAGGQDAGPGAGGNKCNQSQNHIGAACDWLHRGTLSLCLGSLGNQEAAGIRELA